MAIPTGRVIPELITRAYIGSELGFYSMAYPDEESEAPLEVRVELSRNGEFGWELAARQSFEPVDSRKGPQPILAAFQSKKLVTGLYEARMTVTQGKFSREESLQFTLIE